MMCAALSLGACSDSPALGGGDSDTEGGDDGDDGVATEGEPSELELKLETLTQMQCGFVESCACSNIEAGDACQDTLTSRWDLRLDAGLARGLTLDNACLDATLARIEAQQCRWPESSLGHVCEVFCAVYHGDVPLGSPCTAHDAQVSDCAQGLVCSDGACTDPCDALTGLPEGETCRGTDFGDQFEDCARGNLCDWETANCIAGASVGESCLNVQCGDGLFCDWENDQCRTYGIEGESCNETPCADDLFCDWDVNRCRSRAQLGENCDSVPCESGLSCSNNNVCMALPVVGQACPQGQCAEEALCDWNIEQCVAAPTVGEACLFGQCSDALWCDFSNVDQPDGQCQAPVAYGEACSGHRQCETGYCPAGYCLDKPDFGEDCSATQVCGKGMVCNGSTCVTTTTRGPAACVYEAW